MGDRVSWEGNGTDSIYYTYEGSGNLVSMNLNGTEYFYTRNLQGDITGLIDSTGTQVVTYSYDSWGKVLSTTGSLADTLGQKNPYRYRGYRLDSETGMYYLNSRYYVPEWGRFFTPDVVMNTTGDLNGYNLYAYAGNNPITFIDDSGFFVETAIDVASAGYSAYEMAKNPSWLNLGMLVWDVAAICIPILPGSYALKATKAVANAVDTVKKVEVKGKIVFQNDLLFNPNHLDNLGRTNMQRMDKGFAPIGLDNKPINLHHIDQTEGSSIIEMTASEHQLNYRKLHANTGSSTSLINRSAFNSWRSSYWKQRSINMRLK